MLMRLVARGLPAVAGDLLLLIESAAEEIRSATSDSGSDPISVRTTLLRTRGTNPLRIITQPSIEVGPACTPNLEGSFSGTDIVPS